MRKIIAEHIFKKGLESDYIHQIIATHEFPHQNKVDDYKEKLRELVIDSVKSAPDRCLSLTKWIKCPQAS